MSEAGFIRIAYELCEPVADKRKRAACTATLARILAAALEVEVKREDVKRELVRADLSEEGAEKVVEGAERPFKIG
jgi:hypothetical protein